MGIFYSPTCKVKHKYCVVTKSEILSPQCKSLVRQGRRPCESRNPGFGWTDTFTLACLADVGTEVLIPAAISLFARSSDFSISSNSHLEISFASWTPWPRSDTECSSMRFFMSTHFVHYPLRFLCVLDYTRKSLSLCNSCIHFPSSGHMNSFWFNIFMESIVIHSALSLLWTMQTWNY